jgi:hypothetical protein
MSGLFAEMHLIPKNGQIQDAPPPGRALPRTTVE